MWGDINQYIHFHDPTSIGNKLGQFLIDVPPKVIYLSPQYKHLLFLAGFVYLCIVAMFLHIAAVIRDFVSPFNCNHIHHCTFFHLLLKFYMESFINLVPCYIGYYSHIYHLFVACWIVYNAFSQISCVYFENQLFSHLSRGCWTSSFFFLSFCVQAICVTGGVASLVCSNPSLTICPLRCLALIPVFLPILGWLLLTPFQIFHDPFYILSIGVIFFFIIDQHVYTQIMSIQTSVTVFSRANGIGEFCSIFCSFRTWMNLPLTISPITR